jgi:hypothetical protein
VPSASSRLGFLTEVFEDAGPAAINILAHLCAGLRAHTLEVAVLQLDEGGVRTLRYESDFDLRAFTAVSGFQLLLMSQLTTNLCGGSQTRILPTLA